MSFIQSLVLDYTDHCATMSEGQKPLSLEGFFKQTTFYHGYGNWPTFFTIHTELGNKAELDQYMALRKDARLENVQKELEEAKVGLDKIMTAIGK